MRTDGKLFKRIRYMLVAVLFMSACSTFADTVTYDLSGNLDVWDVTGTYDDDSLGFGCVINYTITQDSAGKITGSGDVDCSVNYEGYDYDLDMSFTVKGTVTQKNNIATVKLNFKFTGWISDGVDEWKFKATEAVTAFINTDDYTIEGTAKIKISGVGSETVAFDSTLPDDMDGSAELSMTVDPTDAKGKKLAGTGTLTLSNSEEIVFTIKGSYNAKKGLDKLTLTGVKIGGKSPGKFTIVINDLDGNINSLKGKSLGQKLAASDIPAD